jgi:hypothetical protein
MTRSNKILMSVIAATALIIVTAILIIASPRDQALLIKIRLEQDGFGSSEERASLLPLPEQLISAIAGVGEFDGEEWGEGLCTFYLYGPSADQLFDAVSPVLRAYPIRQGSRIIRRYGPKGASERVTDLPAPPLP